MKTFELFCKGLALWTLIEGSLIMGMPDQMRSLTLRLFPKTASFLQEVSRSQFRGYGMAEATFGLLLGGYFFFLT